MAIDAFSLLKQRVAVVINTSSGGGGEAPPAKLRAVFDHAGLPEPTIKAVTSDEIDAALDEAIAACNVLVVLAGDGTMMAAAERCSRAHVPLIPLPGGTMNMLCRALYGAIGWELALAETLAAPQVRIVSGGRAQDRPFYCIALLGAPALWADAREALRRGDLVGAAARSVTAIRRHGGNRLNYRMGDVVTGSAEAVAVICPLVSRSMAPDEPTLEAVALDPASAAQAFRLAMHALLDDWRHDPSVERTKVKTLTVTGHGRIPVILDGETVKMGRAVTITFQPMAFQAITPADRT